MKRCMGLLVSVSVVLLITGCSSIDAVRFLLTGKLPANSQSAQVTPISQSVTNPTVKEKKQNKPIQQDKLAASDARARTIIASQKPIERGELIPEIFAQALLMGKWKNSSCTDKVSIEFTVTEVRSTNTWPLIFGSLRVLDRSQQSDVLIIDALFKGSFDPARGFLAANAVSKPTPDFTHPFWETMVMDRAPEMARLRQKYFEEKQAQNLKLMFSGKANETEQAARDFDNSRGKEIQKEIVQIHDETLAKLKKEFTPIPLIPLAFDVARDTEGNGWIGPIESEALAHCHEIQFISAQGFTTEKLPPITGQVALDRAASKDIYSPTPMAQAYWLHVAEQHTDEKDFLLLGQVYESQGQRDPQNYARAVQYYWAVLKQGEDARAQKPLAWLYTKGLGTPKDPVEAQRLNQLADRANLSAHKACSSPQSVAAIKSMLSDIYKPRKAEFLSVQAVNVISVNKPFECEVRSKPNTSDLPSPSDVGNKVFSSIPDKTYETTTTYKGGFTETTYSDNSIGKAMTASFAMLFATMAAEEAEKRVYTDSFKVDHLGDFDHKITWNDARHRYPYPTARTIEVH